MADSALTQAATLIKQTEGFIPGVYRDPKGIATIGYGNALVVKAGNPPTWQPLGSDQIAADLKDTGITLTQQQSDTLQGFLTANAAALNGQPSPTNDLIPSDQPGATGTAFNGTAAGYTAPTDLQFLSLNQAQADTVLSTYLNAPAPSGGGNGIRQNLIDAVYNNIDDADYPGMTADQLKAQIGANIDSLPSGVQAVLYYTAFASGASDPYLGAGTANNDKTSQIASAIIPPGNVTQPNVVGESGVVDQLSTNTFGTSTTADLVPAVRGLLGGAVLLNDEGHPVGGLIQTGSADSIATVFTGEGDTGDDHDNLVNAFNTVFTGDGGVPINVTAVQNAAGETTSLTFKSSTTGALYQLSYDQQSGTATALKFSPSDGSATQAVSSWSMDNGGAVTNNPVVTATVGGNTIAIITPPSGNQYAVVSSTDATASSSNAAISDPS